MPNPISIENRRWDPVTGVASSLLKTGTGMVGATSGIFLKPAQEYRRGRSRSANPTTRSSSTITSASSSRPQSHRPPEVATIPPSIDAKPSFSSPDSTTPQTTQGPSQLSANLAARMALASGASVGTVLTTYTKGVLVDLPLATATGFRALPRLWSADPVPSYGRVTDVQSGFTVAGKTAWQGVGGGFRELARKPEQAGAWAAVKHVAGGSGRLVCESVGAGVGLVAYPGQGISKSLWRAVHASGPEARVAKARRAEGAWRVGGDSFGDGVGREARLGVLKAYRDFSLG